MREWSTRSGTPDVDPGPDRCTDPVAVDALGADDFIHVGTSRDCRSCLPSLMRLRGPELPG
jgi:hypothetical protein